MNSTPSKPGSENHTFADAYPQQHAHSERMAKWARDNHFDQNQPNNGDHSMEADAKQALTFIFDLVRGSLILMLGLLMLVLGAFVVWALFNLVAATPVSVVVLLAAVIIAVAIVSLRN